jgi:hypothetical protein
VTMITTGILIMRYRCEPLCDSCKARYDSVQGHATGSSTTGRECVTSLIIGVEIFLLGASNPE